MQLRFIANLAVTVGLLGWATVVTAQTVHIGTNSTWHYLADGTHPDPIWLFREFDDAGWADGVGKFGFGGDGERTVIGAALNGYISFYFRSSFELNNASQIRNLAARFIRDDGLVLYLNGQEAFRHNMPDGPISADTQALTPVSGTAENEFYAVAMNPSLLVEGTNVIAAEVHQRHGNGFSSDLGFYLELLSDVPPEIVNPINGEIIQSVNVTLNATVSDLDATLTDVRFFLSNGNVETDSMPPYSVVTRNVVGAQTVLAVTTDAWGTSRTSAPVAFTAVAPLDSLIAFGADWRYSDNGLDPGASWKEPWFPDSDWLSGPAELGYGDNDEATVLSFGPAPTNKFFTTYFRHRFYVPDPLAINSLTLRVVRDDGIALYLNGVEILRDNLPADANHFTPATTTVEDNSILVASVSPALLMPGENLIAAEIHQATPDSSDISFDLNLIPNAGWVAPHVEITAPADGASFTAPANITISAAAYDLDGAISNIAFYADGALIGTRDTSMPYSRTISNLSTGWHTLAAIAMDRTGLTRTTAVMVVVGEFCERRTNTFQNGVLGYSGSVDTHISESSPLNDASGLPSLTVLGRPGLRWQALLRFEDLSGPDLHQIPPGSIVESAELQLTCSASPPSGSLDNVNVHRVLTPWAPDVTWATGFGGNGIETNDTEAAALLDNYLGPTQRGMTARISIPAATVQQWLDAPEQNLGWALLSIGLDDYRFESSESIQISYRPALTVTYCVPAERPVITLQPVSQVSPYFRTVTFTVAATGDPDYQWFHNHAPITDATNSTLVLTNVQRPEVGIYYVTASNIAGIVTSVIAELQVELTQLGVVRPGVVATDNPADLDQFLTGPPPPPPPPPLMMQSLPLPNIFLTRGVPVFFSNIAAPGQAGVTHCGVPSTHTKWVGYFSPAAGSIPVSTIGSSFDTVLAVYTNFNQSLVRVACNRDGDPNGASVVVFSARPNLLYYIAVDGENGQSGVARLQVGENILQSPTFNAANNSFAFEVILRPNLPVQVRRAGSLLSSFSAWPLLNTFQTNRDSVRWYIEPQISAGSMRVYGAREQTSP